MTQSWGFDLSASAVRLMHRDADEWREIGSEPMDGEGLTDRLRKLAEQVPEPREVAIFLPRDQILYTNVALTDPDNALPEIEAAMAGRTPYELDDLEIDWERDDQEGAQVAAIARVTLEEAEDFAAQCGLKVAGFTALADPTDFPRAPDFGGGKAASPATEPDPAPVDATTDAPDTETLTNPDTTPSGPVVHVEDSAPVVETEVPEPLPLDPDTSVPGDLATPRVRTDVALAEGGSRAAASLTPPQPIDPYGKTEPDPVRRTRGIVAGLAAVLTAGLALIVWSILPDAPDTGAAIDAPPDPEPIAETQPAPVESPPTVVADIAPTTEAPEPGTNAELPVALLAQPTRTDAAPLPEVTATSAPLPELPSPVGPRPTISTAVTVTLAALTPGGDDAGLTFETPKPPATRPGSVALPAAQSFNSGVAPPSDTAPEYVAPVIPAPPEVVEAVIDPDAPVAEDVTQRADIIAALPPSDELDEVELLDPVLSDGGADPEIASLPPVETEEIAAPEPPTEPTATVAEAPVEPIADTPDLPAPTALAAALPDRSPPPRPSNFLEEIERQTFGGRTKAELASIRPPARPQSAQSIAEAERENTPPSALAVAQSPSPDSRPQDIIAIVVAARAAAAAADRAAQEAAEEAERQRTAAAAATTTDTSSAVRAALDSDENERTTAAQNSPRLAIPSSTSVARQATIDEAIRLNRINLVGVYGLPTDRRALIRLPSGRYVKVKIGDPVDGGTVAAISDNSLQYRKGGQTIQLSMPQG